MTPPTSNLRFPPSAGKTITPVPGFPGFNVHTYPDAFFLEEGDKAFSRLEVAPLKRAAAENLIREKFPHLASFIK